MNIVEKFRATVRAAVGLPLDAGAGPDLMRLGLYRATVQACAPDGSTLDLSPEDARIPGIKQVPVRVGIPGAVATVQPGAVVLLGWEKGDPSKPYCAPSWESGATVTKLVLSGQTVILGAESGAQFVALSNKVNTELGKIASALSNLNAPSGGGTCTGNTYTAPGSVAAAQTKAA
jgi:hypothetical protein